MSYFPVLDKIKDPFVYFFDKFGTFIEILIVAFHHIYFWVAVLLFIALVVAIFYGAIKLKAPFVTAKKMLNNVLNKV